MPINRTGLPHAVASTSQTQEALTSQASGAKESRPRRSANPACRDLRRTFCAAE